MSENVQPQRWMREFMRYLPIKTQFYFYGNIYDKVPHSIKPPGSDKYQYIYLTLRDFFREFLTQQGYRMIGFYDMADGLIIIPETMRGTFESLTKVKAVKTEPSNIQESNSGGSSTTSQVSKPYLLKLIDAVNAIRTVIANKQIPCAFVFDFASRLVANPNQLYNEEERIFFLKLLKCSQEAARVKVDETKTVNNNISLICDKLNDIPSWMYMNNPFTKSIHIDLPNEGQRGAYFDLMVQGFHEWETAKDNLNQIRRTFVDLTQGLRIYELESLRILSVRESIPLNKVREVIERYKYGVTESMWDLVDYERLANAEGVLRRRVKGQDEAIRMVLDIIKRAKMGLSGVQHSSRSNRPRGVLFFAGPTGVGKTEMAKALAELLFGDEQACVRFDMSEYAQEQSDQRLLGAPPGYVGYEEGGQLTNSLKENPFCVLLFDEIEKAHPRIFDKFLQILEDGRMTDGKGETVYFSESIIIFTSNIGTTREDERGQRISNVDPSMKHEEVREKILKAIEEHFKFQIGRPELFNRFGNNFVIFDFIRPEVMDQIVDKVLENIITEVRESHSWSLEFTDGVREDLYKRARSNIAMGGRGAGNMIEEVIVNPLGRYLFENPPNRSGKILITGIEESRLQGKITYSLRVQA